MIFCARGHAWKGEYDGSDDTNDSCPECELIGHNRMEDANDEADDLGWSLNKCFIEVG